MREDGSNHYHLTTLWKFNAPLDTVWEAIFDCEAWPQWWRGAERVITLECGDAGGLGARRHYTWKSVLPFRLSFVSRVTRIEPLRLIEGCVEGDLTGKGCCRFWREQALTIVSYEWQVRTTHVWMNLLAPLAKPVFRWNHDALMHAGGIGLARHLDARRSSQKTASS